MSFNLIVAVDQFHRIGYTNQDKPDPGTVLYPISHDLQFFSHITRKNTRSTRGLNAVVMGHNTWKSLPTKYRPLPDRLNIILSRTPENVLYEDKNNHLVKIRSDFTETITELLEAQERQEVGDIFVMGGANVYQMALKDHRLDKLFITHIQVPEKESNAIIEKTNNIEFISSPITFTDTTSLEWSSNFFQHKLQRGLFKDITVKYQFCQYRHVVEDHESLYYDKVITDNIGSSEMVGLDNHEERQYLRLLKKVVTQGDRRTSRNGSTRSIFGVRMEFDLTNGSIPLLTTKKMAWKTVIRELLWFLSGDTNAKTLQKQKVKIGDGNSSREYLDSIGLTDREEGDLGPVYGFQWRHFGATYKTCHDSYDSQGVDQIMECLRQIKESPSSRRILFSGWNPLALKEMALPPCHLLCQFFVDSNECLSLQLYQRSGDSFLGIPFNIFSYSVLLLMFCQLTGKKPGKMIHVVGDFHVYENHLDAVSTQLSRNPMSFPQLEITPHKNLEDYQIEDFKLKNYHSHGMIKAPMAA